MPNNKIEYTVSRSFDLNSITLLESLIEYMDDEEVIIDESPDSRDIL